MGAINIEYVLISDVFNLYVELTKSMQWQEHKEKPKAMGKQGYPKEKEKCVSKRNKCTKLQNGWFLIYPFSQH